MPDFSGNNTQNQNNGNQRQFQVTTNMLSMFDDQSVQLRLIGLDNALSIAFWLPVPNEGGKNSYPQDHRFSVILPPERVAALCYLLDNDIVPAFNAGKNISRGIFTTRANTTMLQISIEEGEIFLYLHRNINENRIPGDTMRFHFNSFMVLDKYDPRTGDYDVSSIQAAFYLFYQTVKMYTMDGCSGSSTHAYRHINRYNTDKIFRYLEAIATKLAVTVATPQYQNSHQGGFNNPAPNQIQGPQMKESDDLASLMG